MIPISNKGQTNLIFTPSATANYGIQVVGNAEVFFLLHQGNEVLTGRDTEGGTKRPKLFWDLEEGEKYQISVRVNGTPSEKEALYVTAFQTEAE